MRSSLADVDTPKHAYLLTNVPTDLPVDEVCTFDELAEPLEALLPVADGALRLAEYVQDAVTGEHVPEGFRAGTTDPIERLRGATRNGEDKAEFTVSALHRLAQLRGRT